jgi:hypothetical protein
MSPHTLHNQLGTPIADSFVVCCCILNDGLNEDEPIERSFI